MPQVVGDRVVTASGIGQIHSLDKNTGQQIWSLDLYKQFGGNVSTSATRRTRSRTRTP